MEAVVRDTLALAGYPDPELHYLDALTRFERLIVLGTVSHHPLVKAPSAIRYLEGLGREVPAGPHRRVYVSRNLGARRRLTNESDLLPLFTARGYHMVSPETLSLVEQISMFKGAQIVAGNLGAGLANLVFSPAGVTVLALTTPRMAHDFFHDIVCHKGGHYRGLQGISTDPQPDIGSDFAVDPAMVTAGLDWAELACGDD